LAFYESVFIARQDVSAAQVDALIETFGNILSAQGATVAKKEYWGLRNLTYRIKKNRKGHFVLLNIDGPAAAVTEMERNMRIHEDVIRYLTIRVETLEEGPSAMLQSRSREGREGRDGRDGRDGGREGGRYRDDDRRPRRPRQDAAPEPAEAAVAVAVTAGDAS
jgi:small subunit ribosomal protein S6